MKLSHLAVLWLAAIASLNPMGLSWGQTPLPAGSQETAGPLTPAESLQAFVLDPQLQIELVASEPQIVDPVAMHFGSDGSLWVVEMRDYPHGPAEGEKPKSRIKRLTDSDGDGHFEAATVFADELLFVTGVLPYQDGLIVTLAGQIAFFADRDGDGVAEFRETWFTGFAQENSQLRANHPIYGPDGWVYVANGLRGGKVQAERPQWKQAHAEPLVITGFDFRFHPQTGAFEAINGHGQFGNTFDDVGRRFVATNRHPCLQIVLENRYLQQNPLYAVKQVTHEVCAAAEKSQLFPISKAWTTSTLHANQFTAACGVTIFRGDGLPTSFYGNAFTCDPTGNLVHREELTPAGATFSGQSPYEGKEFLASPDTWFRPVNLGHGPEGGLYVVDMYRAVIEHPDFMPEELKRRPDLLHGTDRGRIYRITTRDAASPLRELLPPTTAGLLAQLAHPNVVQREAALRQLVEHPPQPFDATLLQSTTAQNSAIGRVNLLRLQQQWGTLQLSTVAASLLDTAPEVRETALQLAEAWPADPQLRSAMLNCARDPDPRVRFQAVQSLALTPADEALLAALADVATQPETDVWTQRAIITAAREQSAALLVRLIQFAQQHPHRLPQLKPFCQELATLVAHESFDPVRGHVWAALQALSDDSTTPAILSLRWSLLDSLGTLLRRRYGLLLKDPTLSPSGAEAVTVWLAPATSIMTDSSQPDDLRLLAIHVSRLGPSDAALAPLLKVALEDPNGALQLAAFEILMGLPQPELAGPLLERFASAGPNARRGILDVLLSHEARTKSLIDALEAGRLLPTELDPTRTQRLTGHRVPELRERAKQLFAAATAERGAVVAAYLPALQLKADPLRGRQVFEKQCVTCHRVGNLGVNVGPDIADSRTKTPDVLLTAILDPNRAIDNNFFGYSVVTEEGKVYTGIITAETTSSITLRQAEGKELTILRSEIDELRNTGLSLMPVGFEKNIPPQEMADLVSFLKNWRYLDGDVPSSVIAP